jgi:hypothetical protein
VDPIAETILEILGVEIARRVLGPESQAVPQPADQALRQGAFGLPSEITIHVDQMQGPPCDVVDELFENRLFEQLMKDEDCGCNQ